MIRNRAGLAPNIDVTVGLLMWPTLHYIGEFGIGFDPDVSEYFTIPGKLLLT